MVTKDLHSFFTVCSKWKLRRSESTQRTRQFSSPQQMHTCLPMTWNRGTRWGWGAKGVSKTAQSGFIT